MEIKAGTKVKTKRGHEATVKDVYTYGKATYALLDFGRGSSSYTLRKSGEWVFQPRYGKDLKDSIVAVLD